MARAKQTIKYTRTKTKTRTKKVANSGLKGNQKKCPTCGRFM